MATTKRIPNRKYAGENPVFRKSCELAAIEPTKRQASKFRNKKGLANTKRYVAIARLSDEARAVAEPVAAD